MTLHRREVVLGLGTAAGLGAKSATGKRQARPSDAGSVNPTVTVLSNGENVSDVVRLRRIQIISNIGADSAAWITVLDGDTKDGWPISDSAAFQLGSAITVRGGYGKQTEEPIFAGIVVEVHISASRDHPSELRVHCRSDNGGNDVATAPVFRPPTLSLKWGEDILGFDMQATDGVSASAVPKIEGLRGKGESGDGRRPQSKDRNRPHGSVQCAGSAKAHVGTTVRITGFGQRFSGEFLITGVTHDFTDGIWVSELRV